MSDISFNEADHLCDAGRHTAKTPSTPEADRERAAESVVAL